MKLNYCHVRCYYSGGCINHLMYADDLVIMSPSVADLYMLIHICESFGLSHVLFNNKCRSELGISKMPTCLGKPNHLLLHMISSNFRWIFSTSKLATKGRHMSVLRCASHGRNMSPTRRQTQSPKDLATQANICYEEAITIPRDRKKWMSVGNPRRTPDEQVSE